MAKEGLNRRGFLKGSAANLGALAAGGGDYLIEKQEGNSSEQARRRIAKHREKKRHGVDKKKRPYTYYVGFDHEPKLFENAAEPSKDSVIPSAFLESRHKHLFGHFSSRRAKYMPTEIQLKLAHLMPGLAAQESRFKADKVSSAGAAGFLQVLPSTYFDIKPGTELSASQKHGFKKFTQNFEDQTSFAFKYFDERIYRTLTQRVDFDKLSKKFGISGDEFNTFMALSMTNAYKAGQGTMAKVLNNFIRGFATKSLPKDFDNTGLGLFAIMSEWSKGKVRSYGKHSSQYTLKVVAGSESLADKFNEPYGLKKLDPIWLSGVIGGAVSYVLADGKLDPHFKKGPYALNVVTSAAKTPWRLASSISDLTKKLIARKNGKPKNSSKKKPKKKEGLTRRHFITSGAATVTAAAGGVYLAKDHIPNPFDLLENVGSGGEYSKSEVPKKLARLKERGIHLTSTGSRNRGIKENGLSTADNRTALVGMKKNVLAIMEQLMEDLDLLDKGKDKIIITGMAEGGHSKRKHGHGNGYAIDLRPGSAKKISDKLVAHSTVINRTTRKLSPEHLLLKSGLVVGDKIFRYKKKKNAGKYFLFGVQHARQTFICYFDDESNHRHMEMIPFENYQKSKIGISGVYRPEVQKYIQANI